MYEYDGEDRLATRPESVGENVIMLMDQDC